MKIRSKADSSGIELSMEDSYGLIVENENNVLGFVMGYFKQYDDIIGYTLDEIIIAYKCQNKGIGW